MHMDLYTIVFDDKRRHVARHLTRFKARSNLLAREVGELVLILDDGSGFIVAQACSSPETSICRITGMVLSAISPSTSGRIGTSRQPSTCMPCSRSAWLEFNAPSPRESSSAEQEQHADAEQKLVCPAAMPALFAQQQFAGHGWSSGRCRRWTQAISRHCAAMLQARQCREAPFSANVVGSFACRRRRYKADSAGVVIETSSRSNSQNSPVIMRAK